VRYAKNRIVEGRSEGGSLLLTIKDKDLIHIGNEVERRVYELMLGRGGSK
jgi:hypothetical protein